MYQPKVKEIQKYSDSQGEHIVHEGKLVLLDQPLDLYPIIISETETPSIGDWVYYYTTNEIMVAKTQQDINTSACKKVLALPEQFSDKHLQAIVDGKIKEGDEVLVKCRRRYLDKAGYLDGFEIDLGLPKKHITLFPAKQSLEEAANEFANFESSRRSWSYAVLLFGFIAGAQWAVKNNYKGE